MTPTNKTSQSLVALIPARSGSKRLPHKNVKIIANLPLLAHSVITAQQLNIPCYLSSDSDHYLSIAQTYGAIPIKRPPELASDTATDYDVIQHFSGLVPFDAVLYLRPTTPFRSTHIVQAAINLWLAAGNSITGLRSVEEMPETVAKCFYVRGGLLVPILGSTEQTDMPNQELLASYRGNGYVDIVRHASAWDWPEKTPWGPRIAAHLTPSVIELDTPQDWDLAEWYVSTRKWVFGPDLSQDRQAKGVDNYVAKETSK